MRRAVVRRDGRPLRRSDCKSCRGEGSVYDHQGPDMCPACFGSARARGARLADKRRAVGEERRLRERARRDAGRRFGSRFVLVVVGRGAGALRVGLVGRTPTARRDLDDAKWWDSARWVRDLQLYRHRLGSETKLPDHWQEDGSAWFYGPRHLRYDLRSELAALRFRDVDDEEIPF